MDTKTVGIIAGIALVLALLSPLVLGSSKTVQTLYDDAENHFEKYQYEKAITLYNKAIKASKRIGTKTSHIDPDFPSLANYKIALCYEKLGEIKSSNYYSTALIHIRNTLASTNEHGHKEKQTFLWAQIYYKNNMRQEAGAKYSYFVKTYSRSPLVEDALYNIGKINYDIVMNRYNRINYEDALLAFNKLTDQFPTTNHRDDAEHRISELLIYSFNDGNNNENNNQPIDQEQFETAIELMKQGKKYDAYLLLNTLMKENPQSQYLPQVYEVIGDMYFDAGNYQNARHSYELAINTSDNPERIQILKNKRRDTFIVPDDIPIGPNINFSHKFTKATFLRDEGKYLEAASLFDTLSKNDIPTQDLIYALYWGGYCFYMSSDDTHLQKGIALLEQLITEYGNTTHIESSDIITTYLYLVKAYFALPVPNSDVDKTDRYELIIRMVNEVNNRFRGSAFGTDLVRLNEMAELKRKAENRLPRVPIPPPPRPSIPEERLVHEGREHFQRGDLEQATISAREALKIKPEFEPAISLLVDILVRQGHDYYNEDKLEQATKSAREALRKNPDSDSAKYLLSDIEDKYYVRGVRLIDRNRFIDAISEFDKCLDINQKNKKALGKIGLVYSYKEEFERSIPPLKEAINIDRNFKQAHFNLGHAYYKLGSLDYAIYYLNIALDIDPNYKSAQVLRDYLRDVITD